MFKHKAVEMGKLLFLFYI